MKDLELSKEIWKIVDAIKKDSEEGYEYFIQSHKNIPDELYEVFTIELTKMCVTNSRDHDRTNPTSIAFNKVLIYLSNDYQKINPIVKIKFGEEHKINTNSFVKYFYLLKKDGKITNTINELSTIIASITNFEPSTIESYLNSPGDKLETNEMLLPNGYMKIPKEKKSRPSS
jgi:hypothetical protein